MATVASSSSFSSLRRIRPLLPRPNPSSHHHLLLPLTPRRPFLSALASAAASAASSSSPAAVQTITATRTLPYPAPPLYDLIADVDAYASFLPHCLSSRVTAWSEPPPADLAATVSSTANPPSLEQQQQQQQQRRRRSYPRTASLTVGWGPLTQSYTSTLYCHPPSGVVEAVSGRASPTLTPAQLRELGLDAASEAARGRRSTGGDTFESLVTRWTVTPLSPSPSPPSTTSTATAAAGGGGVVGNSGGGGGSEIMTRVELRIRYKFANPVYQLATGKFADDIAGIMIEAFEKRAREKLGGSSNRR